MSSHTVYALCLFAAMVFYCVNAQQGNFGNGNINSLLSDTNLVQREIRCILDKGPCDQIGKQLKAALPEVLNRNCRSCSPAQAANARKLIAFVQQQYPDVYAQVLARYRG